MSVAALGALGKIKGSAWKSMGGAFKEMKSAGGGLIDFGKALQFLEPLFKPINILLDVFGKGIMQGMMPAIQMLTEILLKPEVIAGIQKFGMVIGKAIGWLIEVGIPIIKKVWDIGKGIFEAIKIGFEGLINGFKWVWNSILKPIWEAIKAAFTAFGNAIKWVWNSVLKPVFNLIIAGWKFLANAIITVINGLITGVNWVIPGVKWDIPLIPKFELGTNFVDQGGLAILHPGEEVRPAKAVKGYKEKKSKTQNIEIHIHGNVSEPERFASAIEERLWGI